MASNNELVIAVSDRIKAKINTSKLEYKYGYAMVEIPANENIGVIDEFGNIILPFSNSYMKVDTFPSNNIIVMEAIRDNDREVSNNFSSILGIGINHYRIVDNKLILFKKNIANDFERVDENVIKLRCINENEEIEEVLYDVEYGEIISETFSSIGSFEVRPNGQELAETKVIIKSEHDDKEYSIIVYIDKAGNIRPVMYNSCTDEIVPYYMWEADYQTTLEDEIEKIKHKDSIRHNTKQYKMELFWNFKG